MSVEGANFLWHGKAINQTPNIDYLVLNVTERLERPGKRRLRLERGSVHPLSFLGRHSKHPATPGQTQDNFARGHETNATSSPARLTDDQKRD